MRFEMKLRTKEIQIFKIRYKDNEIRYMFIRVLSDGYFMEYKTPETTVKTIIELFDGLKEWDMSVSVYDRIAQNKIMYEHLCTVPRLSLNSVRKLIPEEFL